MLISQTLNHRTWLLYDLTLTHYAEHFCRGNYKLNHGMCCLLIYQSILDNI